MSPAQQAAFEQFWRSYPRRVGKIAAAKEWERRKPNLEDVLTALAWQTQQAQWQDVQFIPHPRTYLSQGRWLDEPPQAPLALQAWVSRESWRDECAREHQGTCHSPEWHQTLMAAPAEYVQRKVAEALERAAKVGA